jgi:hypothetical protein
MGLFKVGSSHVGGVDHVGGQGTTTWVDGPSGPVQPVAAARQASTTDVRLYLVYNVVTTGTVNVVDKLDEIVLRITTSAGVVDKTFSFASDAMGMLDLGTTGSVTFAHDATDGDPAGCVKFTTTAAGSFQEYGARNVTGETWETWGVQAGATVTSIQILSWKYATTSSTGLTSHKINMDVMGSTSARVTTNNETLLVNSFTPPLELANTFEGGTDGTAISLGNSGGASGDAWDGITAQQPVYDDDYPISGLGSMTASISTTTSAGVHLAWNGLDPIYHAYVRGYFRFSALPAVSWRILLGNDASAGGVQFSVYLLASGKLRLLQANDGQVYQTATALAAGDSFRVEVLADIPSSRVEMRMFTGANLHSTTPTETSGSLSCTYDGADVDEFRFGLTAGQADVPNFSMDDLAVANTGWIGPSGTSGTNHEQTITDPIGLLDSQSQQATLARSRDDLIGITDPALTQVAVYAQTITDAVGITDGETEDTQRPTGDLVGILDSITAVLTSARSPPDELVGITDSITQVHSTAHSRLATDPIYGVLVTT